MPASFERIVYFGDSITDGGTIFDLTSQLLVVGLPPADAGYQGVFTDGRVFADVLAERLGVAAANFGVGAARAIGQQPIGDLIARNGAEALIRPGADLSLLGFDINLGGQIGRFLAVEAAAPDPRPTAASLLIGLNDISSFQPTTADPVAEATALLQGVIGQTVAAAQTLAIAGGVDRVILYTFPPVSFFPFSQLVDPALLPFGDLLIEGYGQAIQGVAAFLNAGGLPTQVVDLARLATEIAADPETFGFLAPGPALFGTATDPTVEVTPEGVVLSFPENPAVAGLDADQIQFFDFLHPTAALHGVIAAHTESTLTRAVHALGEGSERLRFTTGDDFVLAGSGNDQLLLGRGDDRAFGGIGRDRIDGGAGSDLISGGFGPDQLIGRDGNDLLAGDVGDDRLFGGAGADVLIDGRGSDFADGGIGDDFFLWTDPALLRRARGNDADLFLGGAGDDTLVLALGGDLIPAVEADIAAEPGFVRIGRFELDAIGLVATGIERVVILEGRDGLAAAVDDPALARLVEEADLWGLV